jgi:hypothetical protein
LNVPHVDNDKYYLMTLDVDGQRFEADCRITWDGIEYVGRVWFTGETKENRRLPDRGALPGRTREEVIALAERLTMDELRLRLSRAQSEKRRFLDLRSVTKEILAKIRYVNQLAVSTHAGLLDVEGAAAEIELTEKQLHELIDMLRKHAGVDASRAT